MSLAKIDSRSCAVRPARCFAVSCWLPGPPRFDPLRPPSPQPTAHAVAVPATAGKILDMQGIDGRPYRPWVAAPGKPPAMGYPVMYLLDGAAVMATLDGADAGAAATAPVLLVAVGYRRPGLIDPEARACDHTPARANGEPTFDPRAPSHRGGGMRR